MTSASPSSPTSDSGPRSEGSTDVVVDPTATLTEAGTLLKQIARRMAENVGADVQHAYGLLDGDLSAETERAVAAHRGARGSHRLGLDAQFIWYAPPLYLVKLLESWPEAFMDGLVFVASYESLTSPAARRVNLARVAGYLNDLAVCVASPTHPGDTALRRLRLSTQLLQREIAAELP